MNFFLINLWLNFSRETRTKQQGHDSRTVLFTERGGFRPIFHAYFKRTFRIKYIQRMDGCRYKGWSFIKTTGPNIIVCEPSSLGPPTILSTQSKWEGNIDFFSECFPGFHGPDCRSHCSPFCRTYYCDRVTGACLHYCQNGHLGPYCNYSKTTLILQPQLNYILIKKM